MKSSAIDIQQKIVLDAIRTTARGEWKVMVVDAGCQRLIETSVKEDDILKENITNVEYIEERRLVNRDMMAIYLLSPIPHIVDSLMADFQRQLYRKSFVIWTSEIPVDQHRRLDQSTMAREQMAGMRVLNINYYPQESHLIIFRDPWSFPTLFHPACNTLVRNHLTELAQKIVSVCVSLDEYPSIRYYSPSNATHEASVLCSHLAQFVQLELDHYAKIHQEFPPASSRPRGTLMITDRSMDLVAPVVHEFTYQAMVHDILSLNVADKVYYKAAPDPNDPKGATREVEISEKDSLWVRNRHLHMKDLLERLAADFQVFKAKNPQFAEKDNPGSLNNIKDMLAGLPQYQEGKDAFSLHLNMASDAMNIFQHRKLGELASIEQSLATGLDEDYRKPKNVADQVIRLLDEDSVTFPDRLRLIIQYLLYREGLVASDSQKLLSHAQLPPGDGEVLRNLEYLGANVSTVLGVSRPRPQSSLGAQLPSGKASEDDSSLSRYSPIVKRMLEEHVGGTLDQADFPFTRPHLDTEEGSRGQDSISQASLRSAKPTWARTRLSNQGPKQRIIVFMAGGATYSESRACYEVSEAYNKDIFLTTSHMLNPNLFLRQIGDLSVDRRRLNLPADQPQPQAPAHLFQEDLPVVSKSATSGPRPAGPTNDVMYAQAQIDRSDNHQIPNGTAQPALATISAASFATVTDTKLSKKDKSKDGEKKKKHHFFSSRK